MIRSKVLMLAWLIGIAGVGFICVPKAEALHVSQQEFVEEFKNNDVQLVLMGAGLQRFTVMKMAAVGLYLPKDIERESLLEDGPRRVEIVFLQRVSEHEMHQFMQKHISANWKSDAVDALSERLSTFLELVGETAVEERHAYTYVPGQGTTVEINGTNVGMIPGEDFAYGLFSAYIGAKPADTRLKRKLMGSLDYHQ